MLKIWKVKLTSKFKNAAFSTYKSKIYECIKSKKVITHFILNKRYKSQPQKKIKRILSKYFIENLIIKGLRKFIKLNFN